MKLNKLTTAMFTAAAIFASASAQAATINVAGVLFDPDNFFDFNSSSNVYETTAFQAGDVISGYGKITQINGENNQNVFCPTCELTYSFGGYTLIDLNPGNPTTGISPTGQFAFTGGWLKVMVDTNKDFNALNKATAMNGTLWLDLLATDGGGIFAPGITLFGSATGTSSLGLTGTGTGYFDVIGGAAQPQVDTNSEPGGSDLTFTSSFQPLKGPIVNGGQVVATHFGTNEIYGNSIPEPASIALLGLGLLGLGLSRRNKKSA